MANPLLALLAQAAPDVASQGIPATQGDPIVVQGNTAGPNVNIDGVEPPFMGNKATLEEAALSLDEAPERSGMFGVKGTLRDLLGVVGDAFLLQSGNRPIYREQRMREQVGDAMAGFSAGDLDSVRGAAERLASLGYADEAQKIMTNYEDNLIRRAQASSLQENRDSLRSSRQTGQITDVRDLVARIIGSPGALANPELADNQIAALLKSTGVSAEQIGWRPGMSGEERGIFAAGDMTVNQQQGLPIRQMNADTARMNAVRPRPQRQPRAQTSLEYTQELIRRKKGGETLSTEEENYLQKQTSPSSSRRGRRSVPSSSPSGGRFGPPRS